MVVGGMHGGGGMHGRWGGMHGRGSCVAGGMCGRGCTWQVVCVAGGQHAWQGGAYGDMVNERAVRILLECILVPKFKRFSFDLV